MYRLAVPFKFGKIQTKLSRPIQYKFYDIEDNKVISWKILNSNGCGDNAAYVFLAGNGADEMLCAPMPPEVKKSFEGSRIVIHELEEGYSEIADEEVEKFLAKLAANGEGK